MQSALYEEKEVVEMLGVSRVTLHRLRKSQAIGFYRIGSRVMYSAHHVNEFLARNERKARKGAEA